MKTLVAIVAFLSMSSVALAETFESGVSFDFGGSYNYIGVEVAADIELQSLENATKVDISFTANDPDFKSEGVLTINGEHVIFLFGDDAQFSNHRKNVSIVLETDPMYWKEGMNTISVKRHEGDGFELSDVVVTVYRNQSVEELQAIIGELLKLVALLSKQLAALQNS